MTTAWAHLPNAAHIDRVLAHLPAHPAKWDAARGAARGAARDAARGAAWDAAQEAAWEAAWHAAWEAVRDAAWGAVRDAAWDAAWGALFALIVWDDCACLLECEPDALRLLSANGHHPATLLLPAVLAMKE